MASDTMAEAFAQALNHRGPMASPKGWIWRSVFKIAAGEKRRRTKAPLAPSAAGRRPRPQQRIT